MVVASVVLSLPACTPAEPLDESVGEEQGLLQAACPPPPAGVPQDAVRAFELLNRRRQAAGLSCLGWSSEIATAAQNHCDYYSVNVSKKKCIERPHNEDPSCTGFTGVTFSERLREARYWGRPAYEVMAYFGSGTRAVDAWIDSVWHRVPMVSPRVRDVGFGANPRCETMDFGYADAPAPMRTVFYPFDGQTEVPTKFEGRENPEPPRPRKGWPSGYPITLFATELMVTSHELREDATGVALDHIFIAPGDPSAKGLLFDEFMLYAHEPLKGRTRYRVVITGEKPTGSVRYEWTFTTR